MSLDYCADQMLLALAPPASVAAVSPQADADPLFSARLARGKPRVRAELERIVALRPTVVVRSYAGGPRLDAALRALGIRVITIPYTETIADARMAIRSTGEALQQRRAAEREVRRIDAALARAAVAREAYSQAPLRALYLTPGSVTAGRETMIGEIMAHANLTSVEPRSGWHRLNIETLLITPPDLVIRAFGESRQHQQDRWAAAEHDVIDQLADRGSSVALPGSYIACGNGRIAHALDRLVQARADAVARNAAQPRTAGARVTS